MAQPLSGSIILLVENQLEYLPQHQVCMVAKKTMMIPLLHHGMVIAGIPYSEKDLNETRTGGTPYGPTHFSGNHKNQLSDNETKLCMSFGKRIAQLTNKL